MGNSASFSSPSVLNLMLGFDGTKTLKENLKVFLSLSPYDKCIIKVSAPVCRLIGGQAYGALVKKFT
jgi:hypothetical protein